MKDPLVKGKGKVTGKVKEESIIQKRVSFYCNVSANAA